MVEYLLNRSHSQLISKLKNVLRNVLLQFHNEVSRIVSILCISFRMA